MRFLSRGRAGVLALVACAVAFAWPLQGTGFNQNSHYALVRALAEGTPRIDNTYHEVGDLSTLDTTMVDGHLYANKAPGLAFATLPAYLALDAAGVVGTGDPTRMLWALGLVGCVLPAVLALLLVRWTGDVVAPGFGTVAAVAVGLGTLLLPFATLFFSHALSAFLVLAAFALLLAVRRGPSRLGLVAAAGTVAGLGVVTEYPNGIALAVLGIYAVARTGWLRRGLAYGAGAFAGLLPLLLYNRWAFGAFTHVSYIGERQDNPATPGTSLQHVPSPSPSFVRTLETLFSTSGLLTLAPVLVGGLVGLPLLYRSGRRTEALVVSSIGALFLLYNSSYGSNFGGFSAGQRYVLPIVPLLGAPLALAFRRFPAMTVALALVSGIIAVATTATHALAGYDLEWFQRVSSRQFTYTPGLLVDVTGWYTILPFFAAACAAAVLAAFATTWERVRPAEFTAAGAAVFTWAVIAAGAPKTPALGGDADTYGGYLAVFVVVAILALAAVALRAPGIPRPRAARNRRQAATSRAR